MARIPHPAVIALTIAKESVFAGVAIFFGMWLHGWQAVNYLLYCAPIFFLDIESEMAVYRIDCRLSGN
jgi:hypothetical protein